MNRKILVILIGAAVLLFFAIDLWAAQREKRRLVSFIFMILLGAAAGLYYAWVVNPVEFVDAAIFHLREDYKSDYVLMAAEIFDHDRSVYEAMRRLDLMGEASAEDVVKTAIQKAEGLGYSEMDLAKMNTLYYVLAGTEPTPTPMIDLTLVIEYAQTATAERLPLELTEEAPAAEEMPPAETSNSEIYPWNMGPEANTVLTEVPEEGIDPIPLQEGGGDLFFEEPLVFGESAQAEWDNRGGL